MIIRFILMMFLLACCVAGIVSFRWTATTTLTVKYKLILFLLLVVVFMTPPILRCPATGFSGTFCAILTYILYYLFVCLFLFFCLMLVRDTCWAILRLCHAPLPSIVHPTAVWHANLGLLVTVVILSAYALFEGIRVPTVKTITLSSDKIKSPFSLVVLSDIHLHRTLSHQKIKGIITHVNALNPDVVLFPGDLIDDHSPMIQSYLPLFQALHAPLGAFATKGNHEFYQKTDPQDYQTAQITLLNNQAVTLRPDIQLIGVPDIQGSSLHQGPQFDAIPFSEQAFSILMAHTPKMFNLVGNSADLQVSGHTHGGQIFPFHFLSWLSEHYLSGLYHQGSRTLYVSRGSGQWGPQMRLLAPAEITYIRLLPRHTQSDKF